MCGFLCNKVAFDELCMGGRTVSETQSWIIIYKTAMYIKRSDKSVL